MKKILMITMLAMVLLLGSMVFVSATNDDDNSTIYNDTEAGIHARVSAALNVRYQNLVCKVDLTNKQIDLLDEYVDSIDLSDFKDELNDDLEVLGEYKNDTNKTAFDAYVTGTVRPDLNNATKALADAKKDFRKYNLSNETKTTILNELKKYKEDYSKCVNDKEIQMAGLIHTNIEAWTNHWINSMDRMEEKDLNITELKALSDEMQAKNDELKALIEEGNITKLNAFIKALRDEHIHAAARFEIERLKCYNDRLKDVAKKNNVDRSFEDIDKKINDADNNAQRGKKYDDGDLKETWKDIKEANKDMREASKDILKQRMKDRVQERGKMGSRGHNPNFDNNNSNDSDDGE